MTVSVLVISHDEIGNALVQAVTKTFEELPLPTTVVNVNSETDPEELLPKLKRLAKNIAQGQGILVLTDIFGATPSNIAQAIQEEEINVKVVSGLNLPMLVRVMNYAELDLEQLAEKAISGGKEGVIEYGDKND